MAWVRLDDLYADHQKVTEVGPLGSAMQVAALCYANRHRTDGFIAHGVARKLLDLDGLAIVDEEGNQPGETLVSGYRAGWSWVVDKLVAAGIWEPVDGGWQIHDYHDYQKSRAQLEAEHADPQHVSQQRREAGRRGGLAKAANRSKALANDSALLADASGKHLANVANAKQTPSKPSSPVPDPVPVPDLNVNSLGARPRIPPARASADARDLAMPKEWYNRTWRAFVAGYGKAPPRGLAQRWPEFCPDESTWREIQAGLGRWRVSRAWALDNPHGDYVTKAETWLADKMYLLHPAPANPETANAQPEGRAAGDAAARPKVYALGDNDDPYWAENHGLLAERRKRPPVPEPAPGDGGRGQPPAGLSALPGGRLGAARSAGD